MDYRRVHVDVSDGKVLTAEEWEKRKLENKSGGFYYVLVRLLDGIDENGYVINWDRDEIRRRMEAEAVRARKAGKKVDPADEQGVREIPISEIPRPSEDTPFVFKSTAKETKSDDWDFDIPFFVQNGSRHNNGSRQEEYRYTERTKSKMNSEERHENMDGYTRANYDRDTANRFYEEARRKSSTARKKAAHVSGEETVQKKKSINAKKFVLSIAVALLIVFGTVTAGMGIDKIGREIQEDRAAQTFGTIAINYGINAGDGIESNLNVGNEKNVTLLELATQQTKDKQGTFIDCTLCAELLASIPDEYFEAGLYSVYAEIEESKITDSRVAGSATTPVESYINHMDRIINRLNVLIEEEQVINGQAVNAANNPTLFSTCHDCVTFQDYLKRNKFASIKDYEEHGAQLLKEFNNYVKAIKKNFANESGFTPDMADLLQTLEEEEPTTGGRK